MKRATVCVDEAVPVSYRARVITSPSIIHPTYCSNITVIATKPRLTSSSIARTQLDTMVKSTMTGTVMSSGRGGTAAAMTQNEQTAEEHSTLEQQPP